MLKENSFSGSVSLNGREIPYSARKSHRSRHLKLQVSIESGLEVVIPQRSRISHSQVESFILEKQRWVLRNLQKLEEISREARSMDSILFLGKEVPLSVIESERKTARAAARGGLLEVRVPHGKRHSAKKAIASFYKKQARSLIPALARAKAGEMKASYSRISVRGQKTRWGSCSSRSALSFNWRLLAAPQRVLEYIVVHELAHLKHRNHSKKFWSLVREHCPDYKEWEKWLRKNRHMLRARTDFE